LGESFGFARVHYFLLAAYWWLVIPILILLAWIGLPSLRGAIRKLNLKWLAGTTTALLAIWASFFPESFNAVVNSPGDLRHFTLATWVRPGSGRSSKASGMATENQRYRADSCKAVVRHDYQTSGIDGLETLGSD
jgi:hypothetical protein